MNEKTLEELSQNKTVTDMWDSFYDEEPRKQMMRFENNVTYSVRFLGPFYKARRIYVNDIPYFKQLVSKEDMKAVVKGNSVVFDRLQKEIKAKMEAMTKSNKTDPNVSKEPEIGDWDMMQDERYSRIRNRRPRRYIPNKIPKKSVEQEIEEVGFLLNRIYGSKTWQRCVLVNAFVSGGDTKGIKIVPLTSKMIERTRCNNVRSDISKTPINGLNAHDFIIQRKGEGLGTEYKMALTDERSFLPSEDIDYVFNKGLIDISEVIKDINCHSLQNQCSYFYRKASDYKMAEDMYQTMFEELGSLESDKAAIDSDNKLDSLPDEAFENRDSMSDPIECLEL